MADREYLRGNPRYSEVIDRLSGDPLYTRIWQEASARVKYVDEDNLFEELPFAFEPKFVTTERDPKRTFDYPQRYEQTIRYGTHLILVCKFPSILAFENEVVELYTDDDGLDLRDDELLTLTEIAVDSVHEYRLI